MFFLTKHDYFKMITTFRYIEKITVLGYDKCKTARSQLKLSHKEISNNHDRLSSNVTILLLELSGTLSINNKKTLCVVTIAIICSSLASL